MYALLDMVTQCTLRGQIMSVQAHPGLCMKYSRWDISYIFAITKCYKIV